MSPDKNKLHPLEVRDTWFWKSRFDRKIKVWAVSKRCKKGDSKCSRWGLEQNSFGEMLSTQGKRACKHCHWEVDYSHNWKHVLPYSIIFREFILFVTGTFVMWNILSNRNSVRNCHNIWLLTAWDLRLKINILVWMILFIANKHF